MTDSSTSSLKTWILCASLLLPLSSFANEAPSLISLNESLNKCNHYFQKVPGHEQDCNYAAECAQAENVVFTVCSTDYSGGELPNGELSVAQPVNSQFSTLISNYASALSFNRAPSSVENSMASGSHQLAGAKFLILCSQANSVCAKTCNFAKSKIPTQGEGLGWPATFEAIHDGALEAADTAIRKCGNFASTATTSQ